MNDKPDDVLDIFYSGVYWYCASAELSTKKKTKGKPIAVGVGKTEALAISDMRQQIIEGE